MDIEKIVREYIDKTFHMSLATVSENKPWVCEVHFAYDEGLNLYYRSLTSRRHSQEIALNPNVAGDIVGQHELSDGPYGVYFEGKAKRLEPGSEQQTAFKCMQERLHVEDETFDEAQRPDGHQFYKISVDTFYVFGKFDESGYKKHELKWNAS